MAYYYSIPIEEMEEELESLRFYPVNLVFRNKPVKEWVYERKLPRSPNHFVRIYTGIQRYGQSAGESRKAGKDAIRIQVIYRDAKGETLVSQTKRVHRVGGWRKNLHKRMDEVATELPQVEFDSRGEPMTLRKKGKNQFWGSRDYPKFKETKPFRAEEIRCCKECDKTTGLTTIQTGTYCYDCLPINLGAESGNPVIRFNGEMSEYADKNTDDSFTSMSNLAHISLPDYEESYYWTSADGNSRATVAYDEENGVILIPNFEVSLHMRGKKMAHKYLEELIDDAYLDGYSVQVIDVDNHAIGFWEKMQSQGLIEGWSKGSFAAEDEIPIIDLNSKKEIEEYGLFRPYEPNPPRKEELRRESLTDAPENNNLFRINCDGVYAVRTIYGPSKIIFGRNMLASNKVSFNRSAQRHLSGVWGLMGLPRNKSGVVSAFGPLKNIEKMPQHSEKPVIHLVNKKELTPNRIVINMKGLVFAYDIVNREVEFYGGVPQSSIVSEDTPPEVVKPEMAKPWNNRENVRDYESLLNRMNRKNRLVRQGLKGEIDVPDEEYISYWNQFAAEDNYEATYGVEQAKIRRKLKNKIKKQAIMGTKAGQWSARKSQELKRQYESACDKKGLNPYKGKKTKSQDNLSKWSNQKWGTASGKKSSVTGEPYFPAKAVAALKKKDLYSKAKRQKAKATRAGKQNARYSDDIRKVVAQYRAESPEWDDIDWKTDKPPAKEPEDWGDDVEWDAESYLERDSRIRRELDEGLLRAGRDMPMQKYEYRRIKKFNTPEELHEFANNVKGWRDNWVQDNYVYVCDFDWYVKRVTNNPIYTLYGHIIPLSNFSSGWSDQSRRDDKLVKRYGAPIFVQSPVMGKIMTTLKDVRKISDEKMGQSNSSMVGHGMKGLTMKLNPDEDSVLIINMKGLKFAYGKGYFGEFSDIMVLGGLPVKNVVGHRYKKPEYRALNEQRHWKVTMDREDFARMNDRMVGRYSAYDNAYRDRFDRRISQYNRGFGSEDEEITMKEFDDTTTEDFIDDADDRIVLMLRKKSKINRYGDIGCPVCGSIGLFYEEIIAKGKKWYCYGCLYEDKEETIKGKGDITLEKYGLEITCPICKKAVKAFNNDSMLRHMKKCGVSK